MHLFNFISWAKPGWLASWLARQSENDNIVFIKIYYLHEVYTSNIGGLILGFDTYESLTYDFIKSVHFD